MVVPSACSNAEPDHIPDDIASHATTDTTSLTEVAAASIKRSHVRPLEHRHGRRCALTRSLGEAVVWNAARLRRRVCRRVCRRRVRRPCLQRAFRPSSVLHAHSRDEWRQRCDMGRHVGAGSAVSDLRGGSASSCCACAGDDFAYACLCV